MKHTRNVSIALHLLGFCVKRIAIPCIQTRLLSGMFGNVLLMALTRYFLAVKYLLGIVHLSYFPSPY